MIRPLTGLDASACSGLHATCDTHAAWSAQGYQELITAHLSYGFFEGDHLKGFMIAQVAHTQADIIYICVDPLWRNRGVGRELINQLEDIHHMKEIFLEVNETNTEALKFYKALGFIPVGVRKGYYTVKGDTHDGIILKRH